MISLIETKHVKDRAEAEAEAEEGRLSCVFIDTQHGSKKGMPIKESASCRRLAEGGQRSRHGGHTHLCWLWPHATAAAAAAKRLLIKITCHKTSLSRAEKYKNDEPATAAAATRIM